MKSNNCLNLPKTTQTKKCPFNTICIIYLQYIDNNGNIWFFLLFGDTNQYLNKRENNENYL
jgi:hypothetical protein